MTRGKFIKDFINFIKRAVQLNEKRFRFGISAVEDEIEDIDDEYVKTGLRLAVDEVDAAIIDEILSNKIELENNKYVRRYMTIVKRTALAIREGLSTRLLILVLLSLADLPPKEQRELEYDLLKDPPSNIDNEPDVNVEGERFGYTSKRQYAMACEDIEYCNVKQGVVFNPARREIIITPECKNKDRVLKIIRNEVETITSSEDSDLNLDFDTGEKK
ncbi:MAG: hypothetical protein FWB73_06500 [Treponema sp.]|nr:hypothetical protein [Treponema sp.]